MVKRTDELDFELKHTESIENFIHSNESEFDDKNFYKLLGALIGSCGKSKTQLAADSCISEPYLYNLIKGEKRPTRDTVIKLAFGLGLGIDTNERLLKLAGYSGFYVRHKRDSILKFAVESGLSLSEADELLSKYGFSVMKD